MIQEPERTDQWRNYLKCLSSSFTPNPSKVFCRPDIAVHASILTQKSSSPIKQDWIEVKQIFRYLYGHRTLNCKYSFIPDWAGNCRDRQLNTGHLLIFGGAFACGSRKQSCMALNTTKAEFVALAEEYQKLYRTRRLVEEIIGAWRCPTILFEDNLSCI